jgi:hypothetical protein
MLAKVKTAAVVGLEGHPVDVEVDISSGLPAMTKVETQHTLHRELVIHRPV